VKNSEGLSGQADLKANRTVVWWIDHLGHGGAQASLVELIEGLSSREVAHCVVVLNNVVHQPYLNRLRKCGAVVRVVGKRALLSGIGFVVTWWWVRSKRFDCAVTFLFFGDTLGVILSRLGRIPRIISCQRSTNDHYVRWQKWILSSTLSLSDLIIVNSSSLVDPVRVYVPRRLPIKIISTGIKEGSVLGEVTSRKIRLDLGVPMSAPLIGGIGRLSHEKGFDIAIQAIPFLKTKSAQLIIVGAGPDKEELYRLGKMLNVSDRIHFVGYRENVRHILRAMDVCTQLSRFEGLPVALLEAVEAECPVVTTGVGGIRDVIANNDHGWLVPEDDPMLIARSIDEAIQYKKLSSQKAKKARQHLIKNFSFSKMLVAWQGVLDVPTKRLTGEE